MVEIASQATPPVCRIMDYDKYRYEQSKKEKEAQKKQKGSILKEVWMRTRIGEHDYQVKAKHIKHFLEEGNKVKVIVKFRGREMAHLKLGEQILNRLAEDLVSVSTVEGRIKLEGKSMIMLLAPKRGGAGSKASDQNKDKDESQEAIGSRKSQIQILPNPKQIQNPNAK